LTAATQIKHVESTRKSVLRCLVILSYTICTWSSKH